MTDIEFKATLQMLVPMIIQVIIEEKDLPVISAVKLLYLSKLYEKYTMGGRAITDDIIGYISK